MVFERGDNRLDNVGFVKHVYLFSKLYEAVRSLGAQGVELYLPTLVSAMATEVVLPWHTEVLLCPVTL
jgi:hypothetical protein